VAAHLAAAVHGRIPRRPDARAAIAARRRVATAARPIKTTLARAATARTTRHAPAKVCARRRRNARRRIYRRLRAQEHRFILVDRRHLARRVTAAVGGSVDDE